MNDAKLNALAAEVMGFTPLAQVGKPQHWYLRPDKTVVEGWNPATCADDALTLLEKTCGTEWWQLAKSYAGEGYTCDSGAVKEPYSRYAETPALAMCFCALRAAGIPETEIQEALK